MELKNVWRCGLTTATVFVLASCGTGSKPVAPAPTSPKAAEAKTESKDAHGHETKGEDNCITIDIGTHEFLGDMDFNSATGSVVLTVNNHATGKPHPHAKAEAMLNVVLDSGTAQIPLTADPAKEDPEGKTSCYKAVAPALKGLKALKGRVNLTIDGKAYLCDLASSH